jgi:hypothetical protein
LLIEVDFELNRAMIGTPDVIEYVAVFDKREELFLDQKVIDSFSHVFIPTCELNVPPAELSFTRMKMPKSINPFTFFQVFLKTSPFQRMVGLPVFHSIVNIRIELAPGNIQISNDNHVLIFIELIDKRPENWLVLIDLVIKSFHSFPSRRNVHIDKIKLFKFQCEYSPLLAESLVARKVLNYSDGCIL